MIVLSGTSDVIRAVIASGEAGTLASFASYRDISATTYTPGRQAANATVGATTTLVSAPGASTQRVIDTINVYNGAARAVFVTIQYYDGTNPWTLWVGYVPPYGTVMFDNKKGFRRLGRDGRTAQVVSEDTGTAVITHLLEEEISLTAAAVGAGTTMSIPTPAFYFLAPKGRPCLVECAINFETSATTVGCALSIIGGAIGFDSGDHNFQAGVRYLGTSSTAEAVQYTSGVSSGVPTDLAVATARDGNNLYRGKALFLNTKAAQIIRADLNMENVSGTVKVKPGSIVQYTLGPLIS